MEKLIDIEYDFRTDSNGGDVDKCSSTLRKYHKILWSKPLPNGNNFLRNYTPTYTWTQNDRF